MRNVKPARLAFKHIRAVFDGLLSRGRQSASPYTGEIYKGYIIRKRPPRTLEKNAPAYDIYDPNVREVPKKAGFASLGAAQLYVLRMVKSGIWEKHKNA